ncbi:MAG TPA: polysaccharide deacetylase, partial [Acidimicrobiaceae bacterium]|nr:polysaccharide deacetylase [Acidimicrobiaceae bacterium]
WLGDLDWAREHEPGGLLTYTMHPQVIGRGHRMLMFETLVDEIEKREDVAFVTLQEASDRWRAKQSGD